MYEHMPTYSPNIPSASQLPYPSLEELLSVSFLRQFSLRDKLDQVMKFSDIIREEINTIIAQKKIRNGYDLDIVLEVPSPDSEEAVLYDKIGADLEKIFGVSNIAVNTSFSVSKNRPSTYMKRRVHQFSIKDHITEKEVDYKLVAQLYLSRECKILQDGEYHGKYYSVNLLLEVKKCIRCLKFKCVQSQHICPQ
jgi:hypothetical protein